MNSIINNETLLNEEDDTSLLVIIIDCNVYSWGNRTKSLLEQELNMDNSNGNGNGYNRNGYNIGTSSPPLMNTSKNNYIGFSKFLEHLMIFINAYLMLNQENQIALIASKIGQSSYIFPETIQQLDDEMQDADNHKNNQNITLQSQILNRLQKINMEINYDQQDILNSSFSAALSMGLCYINRIKKESPNLKPRILVFNISPDVSSQYIPVMNCIFSAQKQSIPVDSCILSQTDSTFLQQASHLTNGIYLKPHKQELLVQYLLTTFLLDTQSRKSLAYPTLKSVDYRASCFCHKKIVDIGFVCSVCLSIFCSHSSSCSTCGTKFSLKIDLKKTLANNINNMNNMNNNNYNNNNNNNGTTTSTTSNK